MGQAAFPPFMPVATERSWLPKMPYEENHKVLPLVDKALHTPDPHYTPPKVIFLNPDNTEVQASVRYEAVVGKQAMLWEARCARRQ